MSREEQKTQTRARILDAAGRSFRRSGFGGVGVDGLAKAAGVTSGAFYVHFGSKQEAFRAAVEHGLADLDAGVRYFQETFAGEWWDRFVRFYLTDKRVCELGESCSLQSLAPEVARAGEEDRVVFETGLVSVAQTVVEGPASEGKPPHRDAALAALAMLVGAVSLGRAMATEAAAHQVADAVARVLLGGRGLDD
ncbi:MAG TPA: TetR/AcrR family transcriptional regulator [Roseateles sp.]